jgi:hypothetical protein
MVPRVTLACFLGFAAPAAAQGVPLVPPAEFDMPYPGQTDLTIVDSSNVVNECSTDTFRAPFGTAGCAWVESGTCHIVVALHSPRANVGDLIRHERGHCNGWPADHPR